MLIYLGIFICKIIEDSLSTLRIIIIANGKKLLGAFLQFFIALIWVIVTGTVIYKVNEDPLKIVFFAVGSLSGSYIGSCIEEKIALGNNVFMVEINSAVTKNLTKELKHFKISSIKSVHNNKIVLMIACPRKKTQALANTIYKYDKKALIFAEKVKIVYPNI